eukprot:TRINITY_DN1610_c4_g1_i1.p2 TRINITY_DN1610_c4_g1~~TRINITY_DN1610_c4_g1_i1.p2  ORF type:complete len:130 (+),score=24.79 TRINITY_DN1610_c4_g1_i1:138-527(+)
MAMVGAGGVAAEPDRVEGVLARVNILSEAFAHSLMGLQAGAVGWTESERAEHVAGASGNVLQAYDDLLAAIKLLPDDDVHDGESKAFAEALGAAQQRHTAAAEALAREHDLSVAARDALGKSLQDLLSR